MWTTPTVCLCLRRTYEHQFELKYGANPHEKPAGIYRLKVSNECVCV